MTARQKVLRTLAVLAAPIGAWLLLRYRINEELAFDHGLLFVGAFFYTVTLWLWPPRFKFRPVILVIHLTALALAWRAAGTDLAWRFDREALLRSASALSILSSAFLLFSFREWVVALSTNRALTLFGLAAVSCYPAAIWLRDLFWRMMEAPTTMAVYGALRLSGVDGLIYGPGWIRHPDFEAAIAPACSGMNGILLFVFMFSVLMVLDHTRFGPVRIAAGYLVGMVLMAGVNIVRIAVLIRLAISRAQERGAQAGLELAKSLFHDHIGWVFYLFAAAVFVAVFYASAPRVLSAGKSGAPRSPTRS
ncbi:MAG: hypothetical protein MOGMAGMI_00510 [Candidatus Omnitrophica bacterium]|nr:hypothetical protein [Candidatus Omnitrophota bacterium]